MQRPLGFRVGFAAIGPALGFLLRTPRIWLSALVPGLLLVIGMALLTWAAFAGIKPMVVTWLGEGTSTFAKLSQSILPWLAAMLTTVLGFLVALALTPPLSAPALEHLVAARERDLGLPPHPPIGFFAEFTCGFRAMVFGTALSLPVLTLCLLLDWFVPLSWLVTVPARWLVVSFAVAWNLLDYPLTLRGVTITERWALMRAQKAAVFGFGLCFAVLFWMPCFGIWLLPVGVIAAVELSARMRQAS